jgi:hypothetical protein
MKCPFRESRSSLETMFPDSATRPARHTHTKDLPGDILVQFDIVAMIGE